MNCLIYRSPITGQRVELFSLGPDKLEIPEGPDLSPEDFHRPRQWGLAAAMLLAVVLLGCLG